MNLLSKTFAELLSSSPSAKQRFILHPILILLQSSSLYSTTSSSNNPPKKSKSSSSPSSPLLSSWSSVTSAIHEKKKEKEKGPEKDEVASVDEIDWPRPSEIPWQAKVANSVKLIGHVQMPVLFESSHNGKCWAATILTQAPTSHSPALSIPIIFEDDLAHIAVCHLKENVCVHITGQLNAAAPPPLMIYQGEASVQVMVHSINFVQEYPQMNKISAPHKEEAIVKNDISVNESWKNGNSMGAAFEKKDNGELLWMNESTPEWIQQKLESLTLDHKTIPESQKTVSVKKEEEPGNPALASWRGLVNNPKQWRDYRENKHSGLVNPKHPDFKNKDSGEALWLNKAPVWVLSGLEGLEFDAQNHKAKQAEKHKGDECWKDLVENPNKWWDNRSKKVNPKHPDFKNKDSGEALWLNNAPVWVLSGLEGLKFDAQNHKAKQADKRKGDECWKDLVENPDKWWDNRSEKFNKKSPDFKHKDTHEGLWLSDSPDWVFSKLPPVKPKQKSTIGKRDTLLS